MPCKRGSRDEIYNAREPLAEDVYEIYIWDALEILFYKYPGGVKRQWNPRKVTQDWLKKRPDKDKDLQGLMEAILTQVNIPQELALYDFYNPSPRIREITIQAVQEIRKEYPTFTPKVPPVVKELLNTE